jgi:hypothetical protein
MLPKSVYTVLAIATACVSTCDGSAHAEIFITTASITRGDLVIVGRVRRPRDNTVHIKISPSKSVEVESSSTGGFRWIGVAFPSTCIVEITSGDDRKDVVIQNCGRYVSFVSVAASNWAFGVDCHAVSTADRLQLQAVRLCLTLSALPCSAFVKRIGDATHASSS